MVLGNFQCQIPANLDIVGQGSIVLAVGVGGGYLDIFSIVCLFFFLSLSLGDDLIQTEILSQRGVTKHWIYMRC